ncbi:hypothetical protein C1646_696120 [Rhizophagus diaphanus]|nr:hypothetical protein C1646_696120 [Rhizophagus diaphanus] [Rhizophagus sp. MUCL 43196]
MPKNILKYIKKLFNKSSKVISQLGYMLPPQGLPSDCAFLFADRQSLSNAHSVLVSNKWSRHER